MGQYLNMIEKIRYSDHAAEIAPEIERASERMRLQTVAMMYTENLVRERHFGFEGDLARYSEDMTEELLSTSKAVEYFNSDFLQQAKAQAEQYYSPLV